MRSGCRNLFGALILTVAMACGGGGGSSSSGSGGGSAPTVTSFTAAPPSIAPGGSTTLSWSVSGATNLSIDHSVGSVTGKASIAASPASTTTYTLTATNATGATTATAVVTVAAPKPLISSFTASPTSISAGSSSTLSWTVSGATSLSIDHSVGTVTGAASATVNPSATTTYTLTATNAVGSSTATATVSVAAAGFIPPGDPGSADLNFTLSSQQTHPISRYVYGINGTPSENGWAWQPSNSGVIRAGGNRWTAYNWETNASNAGTDYGPYHSDDLLSSSSTPGAAVTDRIDAARAGGNATLITLQLQGFVAADENGNVSASQVSTRFFPVISAKGSAFSDPPDLTDKKVYMDEFLNLLKTKYPDGFTASATEPIFIDLDNEPDLWNSTFNLIQPTAPTYAQMLAKSVGLASALKAVAPDAKLFGPVSYGFSGYWNFQGASDAPGTITADGFNWWLDAYLAAMKSASDSSGTRMLDVLDVHWYPETYTSTGNRITDDQSAAPTAEMISARLQAPRALWDTTFGPAASDENNSNPDKDSSWIAHDVLGEAVQLIPRLEGKIAHDFPGTLLSISEYEYGGGLHISGAMAEADCLGIFGRQGVFSATYWAPAYTDSHGAYTTDDPYILAGFRMFLDYDDANSHFGDTGITATTSDVTHSSVYASMDAGHSGRVVIVAINKASSTKTAAIRLTHTQQLHTAQVWSLVQQTAGTAIPKPARLADITLPVTNAFILSMPAYSVTTVVVQ